MKRLPLLLAITLLACGGEEAAREAALHQGSGTVPPEGSGAAPAPCMPAGLEAAHEAPVVRLPGGCSWVSSAPLTMPDVIADADALAAAIHCGDAAALPTIDFASEKVHVVQFSMSPAYAGFSAMDDGVLVTYVMRDRANCPGDPLPMPMSITVGYRMPAGASRTYAQASCVQPTVCP